MSKSNLLGGVNIAKENVPFDPFEVDKGPIYGANSLGNRVRCFFVLYFFR